MARSPGRSGRTTATVGGVPGVEFVTLHGHRRAFVRLGRGPVLLLLHGLGCDHRTWDPVLHRLARRHTVIAPDLLGHGDSDKPRADYSIGGYANGMRDLLTLLGIDQATVVGHSFGGGVAMQFAYQFPERTARVALVSSGGLGPEVSVAIRAISTPGFHQVAGLVTLPGMRHVTTTGLRLLARSGLSLTRDLAEGAAVLEGLADSQARAAMAHVVRSVVDWRGQIVSMSDRAYLTEAMPTLLVWGEDDAVIPVAHLHSAARLSSGVRTEVLADSGHFPHKDHPERFAELLEDFVATTAPAVYDRARFRALLRAGPDVPPAQAPADQAPVAPSPPPQASHACGV